MKQIKVLGPGCAKCQELLKQTQLATLELGLECSIEKVTDIRQITQFGVLMTPALVVDGQVKISGRVPSMNDLKKLLAQ